MHRRLPGYFVITMSLSFLLSLLQLYAPSPLKPFTSQLLNYPHAIPSLLSTPNSPPRLILASATHPILFDILSLIPQPLLIARIDEGNGTNNSSASTERPSNREKKTKEVVIKEIYQEQYGDERYRYGDQLNANDTYRLNNEVGNDGLGSIAGTYIAPNGERYNIDVASTAQAAREWNQAVVTNLSTKNTQEAVAAAGTNCAATDYACQYETGKTGIAALAGESMIVKDQSVITQTVATWELNQKINDYIWSNKEIIKAKYGLASPEALLTSITNSSSSIESSQLTKMRQGILDFFSLSDAELGITSGNFTALDYLISLGFDRETATELISSRTESQTLTTDIEAHVNLYLDPTVSNLDKAKEYCNGLPKGKYSSCVANISTTPTLILFQIDPTSDYYQAIMDREQEYQAAAAYANPSYSTQERNNFLNQIDDPELRQSAIDNYQLALYNSIPLALNQDSALSPDSKQEALKLNQALQEAFYVYYFENYTLQRKAGSDQAARDLLALYLENPSILTQYQSKYKSNPTLYNIPGLTSAFKPNAETNALLTITLKDIIKNEPIKGLYENGKLLSYSAVNELYKSEVREKACDSRSELAKICNQYHQYQNNYSVDEGAAEASLALYQAAARAIDQNIQGQEQSYLQTLLAEKKNLAQLFSTRQSNIASLDNPFVSDELKAKALTYANRLSQTQNLSEIDPSTGDIITYHSPSSKREIEELANDWLNRRLVTETYKVGGGVAANLAGFGAGALAGGGICAATGIGLAASPVCAIAGGVVGGITGWGASQIPLYETTAQEYEQQKQTIATSLGTNELSAGIIQSLYSNTGAWGDQGIGRSLTTRDNPYAYFDAVKSLAGQTSIANLTSNQELRGSLALQGQILSGWEQNQELQQKWALYSLPVSAVTGGLMAGVGSSLATTVTNRALANQTSSYLARHYATDLATFAAGSILNDAQTQLQLKDTTGNYSLLTTPAQQAYQVCVNLKGSANCQEEQTAVGVEYEEIKAATRTQAFATDLAIQVGQVAFSYRQVKSGYQELLNTAQQLGLDTQNKTIGDIQTEIYQTAMLAKAKNLGLNSTNIPLAELTRRVTQVETAQAGKQPPQSLDSQSAPAQAAVQKIAQANSIENDLAALSSSPRVNNTKSRSLKLQEITYEGRSLTQILDDGGTLTVDYPDGSVRQFYKENDYYVAEIDGKRVAGYNGRGLKSLNGLANQFFPTARDLTNNPNIHLIAVDSANRNLGSATPLLSLVVRNSPSPALHIPSPIKHTLTETINVLSHYDLTSDSKGNLRITLQDQAPNSARQAATRLNLLLDTLHEANGFSPSRTQLETLLTPTGVNNAIKAMEAGGGKTSVFTPFLLTEGRSLYEASNTTNALETLNQQLLASVEKRAYAKSFLGEVFYLDEKLGVFRVDLDSDHFDINSSQPITSAEFVDFLASDSNITLFTTRADAGWNELGNHHMADIVNGAYGHFSFVFDEGAEGVTSRLATGGTPTKISALEGGANQLALFNKLLTSSSLAKIKADVLGAIKQNTTTPTLKLYGSHYLPDLPTHLSSLLDLVNLTLELHDPSRQSFLTKIINFRSGSADPATLTRLRDLHSVLASADTTEKQQQALTAFKSLLLESTADPVLQDLGLLRQYLGDSWDQLGKTVGNDFSYNQASHELTLNAAKGETGQTYSQVGKQLALYTLGAEMLEAAGTPAHSLPALGELTVNRFGRSQTVLEHYEHIIGNGHTVTYLDATPEELAIITNLGIHGTPEDFAAGLVQTHSQYQDGDSSALAAKLAANIHQEPNKLHHLVLGDTGIGFDQTTLALGKELGNVEHILQAQYRNNQEEFVSYDLVRESDGTLSITNKQILDKSGWDTARHQAASTEPGKSLVIIQGRERALDPSVDLDILSMRWHNVIASNSQDTTSVKSSAIQGSKRNRLLVPRTAETIKNRLVSEQNLTPEQAEIAVRNAQQFHLYTSDKLGINSTSEISPTLTRLHQEHLAELSLSTTLTKLASTQKRAVMTLEASLEQLNLAGNTALVEYLDSLKNSADQVEELYAAEAAYSPLKGQSEIASELYSRADREQRRLLTLFEQVVKDFSLTDTQKHTLKSLWHLDTPLLENQDFLARLNSPHQTPSKRGGNFTSPAEIIASWATTNTTDPSANLTYQVPKESWIEITSSPQQVAPAASSPLSRLAATTDTYIDTFTSGLHNLSSGIYLAAATGLRNQTTELIKQAVSTLTTTSPATREAISDSVALINLLDPDSPLIPARTQTPGALLKTLNSDRFIKNLTSLPPDEIQDVITELNSLAAKLQTEASSPTTDELVEEIKTVTTTTEELVAPPPVPIVETPTQLPAKSQVQNLPLGQILQVGEKYFKVTSIDNQKELAEVIPFLEDSHKPYSNEYDQFFGIGHNLLKIKYLATDNHYYYVGNGNETIIDEKGINFQDGSHLYVDSQNIIRLVWYTNELYNLRNKFFIKYRNGKYFVENDIANPDVTLLWMNNNVLQTQATTEIKIGDQLILPFGNIVTLTQNGNGIKLMDLNDQLKVTQSEKDYFHDKFTEYNTTELGDYVKTELIKQNINPTSASIERDGKISSFAFDYLDMYQEDFSKFNNLKKEMIAARRAIMQYLIEKDPEIARIYQKYLQDYLTVFDTPISTLSYHYDFEIKKLEDKAQRKPLSQSEQQYLTIAPKLKKMWDLVNTDSPNAIRYMQALLNDINPQVKSQIENVISQIKNLQISKNPLTLSYLVKTSTSGEYGEEILGYLPGGEILTWAHYVEIAYGRLIAPDSSLANHQAQINSFWQKYTTSNNITLPNWFEIYTYRGDELNFFTRANTRENNLANSGGNYFLRGDLSEAALTHIINHEATHKITRQTESPRVNAEDKSNFVESADDYNEITTEFLAQMATTGDINNYPPENKDLFDTLYQKGVRELIAIIQEIDNASNIRLNGLNLLVKGVIDYNRGLVSYPLEYVANTYAKLLPDSTNFQLRLADYTDTVFKNSTANKAAETPELIDAQALENLDTVQRTPNPIYLQFHTYIRSLQQTLLNKDEVVKFQQASIDQPINNLKASTNALGAFLPLGSMLGGTQTALTNIMQSISSFTSAPATAIITGIPNLPHNLQTWISSFHLLPHYLGSFGHQIGSLFSPLDSIVIPVKETTPNSPNLTTTNPTLPHDPTKELDYLYLSATDWLKDQSLPDPTAFREHLTSHKTEYLSSANQARTILNRTTQFSSPLSENAPIKEIAQFTTTALEEMFSKDVKTSSGQTLTSLTIPQAIVTEIMTSPEVLFIPDSPHRVSIEQYLLARYRPLLEQNIELSLTTATSQEVISKLTNQAGYPPNDQSFSSLIGLTPQLVEWYTQNNIQIPLIHLHTPDNLDIYIPIINNPSALEASQAYGAFDYRTNHEGSLSIGYINVSGYSLYDPNTNHSNLLEGLSTLLHEIDHAIYFSLRESQLASLSQQLTATKKEIKTILDQAIRMNNNQELLNQYYSLTEDLESSQELNNANWLEQKAKLRTLEIKIITTNLTSYPNLINRYQYLSSTEQVLTKEYNHKKFLVKNLSNFFGEGLATKAQQAFLLSQSANLSSDQINSTESWALGHYLTLHTLASRNAYAISTIYGAGQLLMDLFTSDPFTINPSIYLENNLQEYVLSHPNLVAALAQQFFIQVLEMRELIDGTPINPSSITKIANYVINDRNFASLLFFDAIKQMETKEEEYTLADENTKEKLLQELESQLQPLPDQIINQRSYLNNSDYYLSLLSHLHFASKQKKLLKQLVNLELDFSSEIDKASLELQTEAPSPSSPLDSFLGHTAGIVANPEGLELAARLVDGAISLGRQIATKLTSFLSSPKSERGQITIFNPLSSSLQDPLLDNRTTPLIANLESTSINIDLTPPPVLSHTARLKFVYERITELFTLYPTLDSLYIDGESYTRQDLPAIENRLSQLTSDYYNQVEDNNQELSTSLTSSVTLLNNRFLVDLSSKPKAGGMGKLYLAWDTALLQPVMIKSLLVEELNQDEQSPHPLHLEAQVVAKLKNPSFNLAYDSFKEDGTSYFVMDYIAGPTLPEYQNARFALHSPITTSEIFTHLTSLATTLDYIHTQKLANGAPLVHADIKPNQVILHPERGPVLLDFGLSSPLQSVQTKDNNINGTPAYMSPSQWKNKPATPADDNRALILIAFELLTGTQAFTSENNTHANYVYKIVSNIWNQDTLLALYPDNNALNTFFSDVFALRKSKATATELISELTFLLPLTQDKFETTKPIQVLDNYLGNTAGIVANPEGLELAARLVDGAISLGRQIATKLTSFLRLFTTDELAESPPVPIAEQELPNIINPHDAIEKLPLQPNILKPVAIIMKQTSERMVAVIGGIYHKKFSTAEVAQQDIVVFPPFESVKANYDKIAHDYAILPKDNVFPVSDQEALRRSNSNDGKLREYLGLVNERYGILDPAAEANREKYEFLQSTVSRLSTRLNERVGKRLLNTDTKVYISLEPRVNAYCLPDGSVVITQKFIDGLDFTDEIAAVLAHELSHYQDTYLTWNNIGTPLDKRLQEYKADALSPSLINDIGFNQLAVIYLSNKLESFVKGSSDWAHGNQNDRTTLLRLNLQESDLAYINTFHNLKDAWKSPEGFFITLDYLTYLTQAPFDDFKAVWGVLTQRTQQDTELYRYTVNRFVQSIGRQPFNNATYYADWQKLMYVSGYLLDHNPSYVSGFPEQSSEERVQFTALSLLATGNANPRNNWTIGYLGDYFKKLMDMRNNVQDAGQWQEVHDFFTLGGSLMTPDGYAKRVEEILVARESFGKRRKAHHSPFKSGLNLHSFLGELDAYYFSIYYSNLINSFDVDRDLPTYRQFVEKYISPSTSPTSTINRSFVYYTPDSEYVEYVPTKDYEKPDQWAFVEALWSNAFTERMLRQDFDTFDQFMLSLTQEQRDKLFGLIEFTASFLRGAENTANVRDYSFGSHNDADLAKEIGSHFPGMKFANIQGWLNTNFQIFSSNNPLSTALRVEMVNHVLEAAKLPGYNKQVSLFEFMAKGDEAGFLEEYTRRFQISHFKSYNQRIALPISSDMTQATSKDPAVIKAYTAFYKAAMETFFAGPEFVAYQKSSLSSAFELERLIRNDIVVLESLYAYESAYQERGFEETLIFLDKKYLALWQEKPKREELDSIASTVSFNAKDKRMQYQSVRKLRQIIYAEAVGDPTLEQLFSDEFESSQTEKRLTDALKALPIEALQHLTDVLHASFHLSDQTESSAKLNVNYRANASQIDSRLLNRETLDNYYGANSSEMLLLRPVIEAKLAVLSVYVQSFPAGTWKEIENAYYFLNRFYPPGRKKRELLTNIRHRLIKEGSFDNVYVFVSSEIAYGNFDALYYFRQERVDTEAEYEQFQKLLNVYEQDKSLDGKLALGGFMALDKMLDDLKISDKQALNFMEALVKGDDAYLASVIVETINKARREASRTNIETKDRTTVERVDDWMTRLYSMTQLERFIFFQRLLSKYSSVYFQRDSLEKLSSWILDKVSDIKSEEARLMKNILVSFLSNVDSSELSLFLSKVLSENTLMGEPTYAHRDVVIRWFEQFQGVELDIRLREWLPSYKRYMNEIFPSLERLAMLDRLLSQSRKGSEDWKSYTADIKKLREFAKYRKYYPTNWTEQGEKFLEFVRDNPSYIPEAEIVTIYGNFNPGESSIHPEVRRLQGQEGDIYAMANKRLNLTPISGATKEQSIHLGRFIATAGQALGALGVRFLQVFGQYYDIPKDYQKEFGNVYDNASTLVKSNLFQSFAVEIDRMKTIRDGAWLRMDLYMLWSNRVLGENKPLSLADYLKQFRTESINFVGYELNQAANPFQDYEQRVFLSMYAENLRKAGMTAFFADTAAQFSRIFEQTLADFKAYYAQQVQATEYLRSHLKIEAMIGGGSINTAYLVTVTQPDGHTEKQVVKILSPNLETLLGERAKQMEKTVSDLAQGDPSMTAEYTMAARLLNTLELWVKDDINDGFFLSDDKIFSGESFYPAIGDMSTSKALMPYGYRIKVEQYAEGDTLKKVISGNETIPAAQLDKNGKLADPNLKSVVTTFAKDYLSHLFTKVADSYTGEDIYMVHSDFHIGNLMVKRNLDGTFKEIVIDRNYYLKLQTVDIQLIRTLSTTSKFNFMRSIDAFIDYMIAVNPTQKDAETVRRNIRNVVRKKVLTWSTLVDLIRGKDVNSATANLIMAEFEKRGYETPLRIRLFFKNVSAINNLLGYIGDKSLFDYIKINMN